MGPEIMAQEGPLLLLEFFYAFALGLFIYIYWESKSMGLHEEVPKDGPGRARYFSNQILSSLKRELGNATPVEVGTDQIIFKADRTRRRLECRNGQIFLQIGEDPPNRIHSLGRRGYAEFKLNETSLQVDVYCDIEPLHPYSFSIRLPLARKPTSLFATPPDQLAVDGGRFGQEAHKINVPTILV